MRLWRALPVEPAAAPAEAGGPLWFPRPWQGGGRHDNPDLYGCLYLAEEPVAAVAEMLAPFRGSGRLLPSMLVRGGRPLALAGVELDDGLEAVDLDDPATLADARLRPSLVATRRRSLTQRQAAEIHEERRGAVGIRWWSTLESTWLNWTLFDRAAPKLTVAELRELGEDDPVVVEAAALLGL